MLSIKEFYWITQAGKTNQMFHTAFFVCRTNGRFERSEKKLVDTEQSFNR